jgi:hypothetical protein
MKSANTGFWLLSIREATNKIDMIHLGSIAFCLIFPFMVVIGKFFRVESLLQMEQEIMYMGSLALGVWLVFDFFWPVLPVSRSYIAMHHLFAAMLIGLALFFELYSLMAIGILLQEGYTFVFRKLFYAPTIELMADLARFTVNGIILARIRNFSQCRS